MIGATVKQAQNGTKCRDCKGGRVIRRDEFLAFWVERFTMDEIEEMAEAIWG